MWEEGGYFTPEIDKNKKPFTIILPPPNANAPLHFGHAMMTIEDILIRYHRMKGESALFLPGADHAGFETQYVFEKLLQKEGKSRFDYDRETLYQMIWDHVQKNRIGMEKQLRQLGFSLDWSRRKFTLDPDIVALVYKTFKKMYNDGLIYRGNRLVNYCTKCGTSFSDLEVASEEVEGTLYYITYPFVEGVGGITIATTRPETLLGDVAVMIHPDDERYSSMIGKKVKLPLTNREIPIIADSYVDKTFGTGAVKVTPSHDFNDFEVAKKHGLSYPAIIGFNGRIIHDGDFNGLKVKVAREEIIKRLEQEKLLVKQEKHTMVFKKCYKCSTILEPLPLPQWYIKVEPLVKQALRVVEESDIAIYPKRFVTIYNQWLENLHDWNISRQVVWGIAIPAWQCQKCHEWIVTEGEPPARCPKCDAEKLVRDIDTFDTWFSSSQWPFVTLQTTKEGDFEYFYPTSVMETGYDILKAWVSRMVMMGLYVTNQVPFKDVVLHGIVRDPKGQKMSKSKGNVINPIELVEKYGADAVRFALMHGTAMGNDQSLDYPKLQAMRNFTNKLWNMARFIAMNQSQNSEVKSQRFDELIKTTNHKNDKEWIDKTKKLAKEVTTHLDRYEINYASEALYEFVWHEFADKYIEDVKNRIDENSFAVLLSLFVIQLKLIHPFMPFITEEIYGLLTKSKKPLIVELWPV